MTRVEEIAFKTIEASGKIEKLIFSEEYGSKNPIIEIEKIAKETFNIDCEPSEELSNTGIDAIFTQRKRVILFNPKLKYMDKKIAISKELALLYYSPNKQNKEATNILARSFLMPDFIIKSFKRQGLSESQILKECGFDNNKFMKEKFKDYENVQKLKADKNDYNLRSMKPNNIFKIWEEKFFNWGKNA